MGNNLCVELLALDIAWVMGFRRVICEVDYTEVIRLVSTPSSHFHWYAAIIKDIKVLLAKEWVCLLQHVYGEGNQAANFLAKHGATSQTSSVWDSPPVGLDHILLANHAGNCAYEIIFLAPFFSFFS